MHTQPHAAPRVIEIMQLMVIIIVIYKIIVVFIDKVEGDNRKIVIDS